MVKIFNMKMTPEEIVNHLDLLPHPEGGYYKETYRSRLSGEFDSFDGSRDVATGIYYLLEEGDFSALHRIKSDETWHFYAGDPLELIEITPDGRLIETKIGNDLLNNEKPQYTVEAGNWFGTKSSGKYSLVGCTVYPGFDFKDFEMGDGEELVRLFPHLKTNILAFTR